MADMRARFTILGESGSGKTCYLLGMCNAMRSDISGYSLFSNNDDQTSRLSRRYAQLMDNSRGKDRFPEITDQPDIYDFRLKYQMRYKLMDFDWIDYPGAYLDPILRDAHSEKYQSVINSINNSDILFICVNGQHLVEGTIEQKSYNVRENCAKYINEYLSGFADQHNEYLPPIVIIVTKCDLFKDVQDEELRQIIQNAFEPLFYDEAYVAIIPVSLGADISDNDYSGKLSPTDVHLPILLGVKLAMLKKIVESDIGIKAAEEAVKAANEELNKSKNAQTQIKGENEREKQKWWGFRNGKYIAQLSGRIQDYEEVIQDTAQRIAANTQAASDLKNLAQYLKDNIQKVDSALSNVRLIFSNGEWQNL